MSSSALLRWRDRGGFETVSGDASEYGAIEVADSWLVTDGSVLALDVHRQRFFDSAERSGHSMDLSAFWAATVDALPRSDDGFPRVDLRTRDGVATLLLHVRPAPERTSSIVVGTHAGADPRTTPTIKGPDLAAMAMLRATAGDRGAEEAVLLADDGSVVEGAYSAIVWWRGSALCVPDASLARVDSVTARSLVTLATALGIDVLTERLTPPELDGREVWALNALHGIRIVRSWLDGPELAAEPGRLALWRGRLAALRRPLPAAVQPIVGRDTLQSDS